MYCMRKSFLIRASDLKAALIQTTHVYCTRCIGGILSKLTGLALFAHVSLVALHFKECSYWADRLRIYVPYLFAYKTGFPLSLE